MAEDGPVRVAVQGGFFKRRNRPAGTRQDRKLEEHLEADRAVYSSCLFKMQLTNTSDAKNTNRPVPTRCGYCYNKGFARLVRSKYDVYGIRNSLNRCTGDKPAAAGSIVSPFEGLRKLIANSCGDWMFQIVMTASGWAIYLLFHLKFQSVCVHDGQLQLLNDFPTVHPVIYVPLRRSFMDHFLISWATLQSSGRIPAYFPTFTQLLDPIFGRIVKLWNGIELSQSKIATSTVAQLEQAAIQYISENIKTSLRLEYPLEAAVSKNGKPATIPYGTEVVKFMIQNVLDKKLSDTLFVPVSVTYEKIPEESESPSMFQAAWNFFCIPVQNRSNVRVNFAHPISVRELLVSFEITKKVVSEESFSLASSQHSVTTEEGAADTLRDSEIQEELQMDPIYESHVIEKVTSLLSAHTLHDALRSTPLMSTHLLSYLLINLYQDTWVPLEKMVQDFQCFIRLVQESKLDTGFSNLSDCKTVILRAAEILGERLIHKRRVDLPSEEFYFKVVEENFLELSYYANHVASFFALEAVVITSILSVSRARIGTFVDTTIDIEFVESEVVTAAKNLIQLLQSEFIFHPPCISVDKAIADMLAQLQERCFISVRSANSHMTRYYRDEDEDLMENIVPGSEKYIVAAAGCEEDFSRFKQFCNIVNPYLRCYAALLEAISCKMAASEDRVDHASVPKGELEAYLVIALQDSYRVTMRQAVVIEETVKNFLLTLKKLQILDLLPDVNGASYFLCEDFKTKDNLALVRDHIMYYL